MEPVSEALRQRIPFRYVADDDLNDTSRILDDQEQEEVIHDIRSDSDRANEQHLVLYQLVLALSAVLHVVYIVSPSSESPLAAFIPPDPSTGRTQWPKAVSALFALAHIALHACVALHFLTAHQQRLYAGYPAPPPLRMLLLAGALAPGLAIVFGPRDWATLLWWSEASAMGLFGITLRRWMEDGDGRIARLEGLKYEAAGA